MMYKVIEMIGNVGGLLLLLVLTTCEQEVDKRNPSPVALRILTQSWPISDREKMDMRLQQVDDDTSAWLPGWIERRGGYSISFPKQSFEIDLEEDFPLGGLMADDDWILNANYIDKTFLRHVLSYELFREMHPNNRAPYCRYVELYLNDDYNGLYVLMQKLDRSSLGLDKRDPTAFIFKEPPLFRPDWTNFKPQREDNFYQQTYPKKNKTDKRAVLDGIRKWLLEAPDAEFWQRCRTTFDLDNITDWHLLLLLSNNSDGILKNFYLYKVSADTPIRVAPWDYDHSFGRDGDNELNMIRPLRPEISILFERLLQYTDYQTRLKTRWLELNDQGLFTPAALKWRMHRLIDEFESLLAANFIRWPVNGSTYYDDNDFAAEVILMEQYIDLRHAQLVKLFAD